MIITMTEMWHNRLTGIALIVVALAVTGCGRRAIDRNRPAGMAFDSIVVDTVAMLTADKNSPRCIIKLNVKTAKGEHAALINDSILRSGILTPDYLSLSTMKMTPKHAVDSFLTMYIKDYKRFYTQVYRQENNKEYAQLAYNLTTHVRGGKDGVTLYIAELDNAYGGQSTQYTIVKNIDERTGHLLRLSDVFVPGYEEALGEAILERLCEMTGKDKETLKEDRYFAAGHVYATENFLLEDHCITFVYVTGEIADREKGEIRIDVYYSDIKGILKN